MYEFLSYRVADVMSAKPVVIRPDTSLADAEAIFERHDFNGLPVVSPEGRLMGIVTKLDLLKAFSFTPQSKIPPYDEIMRQPVERVMTEQPLTVAPDTPLTRVLQHMLDTRYKSFPVLQEDRLVGIVAREDIMRALRRAVGGTSRQP
jgi:CBS domain-containing protein